MQELCDCEGRLIVHSFHGEGEGLHNYTMLLWVLATCR